ncbi:MAG: aminoacyl-tRNA hydrolase [Acidobacteriia bacterium]|nr:aminoacyl-tRNA hydrolase [Terriglobia bacterium]
MRMIVGLGNPGERYEMTPHNLGFLVIDELARLLGVSVRRNEAESLLGLGRSGENELVLVKPQTYMNLSGRAVRRLLERWESTPRDLTVVVDDLDLPWGQLRIRDRGSAGTHNGMRSIVEMIESTDFSRVRMGVRPDHAVEDAARFVLSPWGKQQRTAVDEFVARGAQAVLTLINLGTLAAMNQFNAPIPEPAAAGKGSEGSTR